MSVCYKCKFLTCNMSLILFQLYVATEKNTKPFKIMPWPKTLLGINNKYLIKVYCSNYLQCNLLHCFLFQVLLNFTSFYTLLIIKFSIIILTLFPRRFPWRGRTPGRAWPILRVDGLSCSHYRAISGPVCGWHTF